jgi:hypothetical protein
MRNCGVSFDEKNCGKIATPKICHLSLLEHICNKTATERHTFLHPPATLPGSGGNATRCFSTLKTHTMLNKYTVQLMALGIAGSLGATAFANDSALIDALVKKGVLKNKEAEQIRAEAARSSHQGSGSKLSLDSSVKSLTLSGDIRARYNYSSATGADPDAGTGPGNISSTSKDNNHETFYDLRLRINADYKVSDDFYAGFGLRTQRDGRNDNTLMGANDRNADLGIGIYRAFLGWNPVEGVSLVAGAQKNPFYTTDLVWDADINPVGFSQKIDLHKTLGVSGIDLSLVSGQFVVRDNEEYQPASNENRDAFLWQTQLVAGIDLGGANLTIAPGYLATNGASDGIHNAAGVDYSNDVQVLLIPGDISGEVAGVKAKFEWDFAYNFAGKDRSKFYSGVDPSRSSDKLAWLLGVRLGENKKKGDLSAQVNYRQTGAGALPNNLSDNEFGFGDSRNMGGFKVGAAYSLSDSAYFGLNYLKFENLRSDTPYTNANSGFSVGEWFQAEVGVKF